MLEEKQRNSNNRKHASKGKVFQSHQSRAVDVGMGISLTEDMYMTLEVPFAGSKWSLTRRRAVSNCQHFHVQEYRGKSIIQIGGFVKKCEMSA